MWNQAKQNKLHAYLLFFIWPFFSLIFALINFRSSWAKNIVWLYTGFYGFTFVIIDGVDANRYRDWLIRYHEHNLSLSEFWSRLMSGQYGKGDYLEPLLSYLTSMFTGDYRVLFMIYGLVFGYFFSRNIWYLIERTNGPLKNIALPILLFFIITLPIWQINGFRFWTASQVFFYGTMRLFYERKKIYLLVATCSIFIHLGFSFVVPLLFIHFIVGARKYLYLAFLAFSIFMASLNIETLLKLIPNLGSTFDERIGSYTHPDFLALYFDKSKSAWFIELKPRIIKFVSYALIVILAFFKRKEIARYKLENLLYFGILIFAVTSLLNVVPSMGRFYTISSLILAAVAFLYLQRDNKLYWLNRFSPVLAAAILFITVVELRVASASIGINAFITNPIIAPYVTNDVSVLDLIK